MTAEIWDSRPVLAHVRDFARARRVGPTAMLGSLLLRAIAATDPRVVLPPVVGDIASLNACVAFVGLSGHGKGATEAAARAATNLPDTPEFPVGSGEGLARTFATNAEGHQEIRRAIFTASEVDGLAAIGGRSGSTLMATIRQLYSGESIGAANAQKHTRLIVPRHGYRACLSIGVQPEAATPILGDTRGTAQRMMWLPVGDPDAPDTAPPQPDVWNVPRTLVPADRFTVLEIPEQASAAMEQHQLSKLRGEDVDPLDGHKMLTRAKIAAGFMLLDGRHHTVTPQDWELAGHLIAVSDRTRAQIARVTAEAARKANRAKAHAAAERDETISARKLSRAKEAVVRWLETHGEMPMNEIRSRARSDWRDQVSAAVAELVDAGQITETKVDRGARYRIAVGVQGGPGVQGTKPQVTEGGPKVQGGPSADKRTEPEQDVASDDNRSSEPVNRPVATQTADSGASPNTPTPLTVASASKPRRNRTVKGTTDPRFPSCSKCGTRVQAHAVKVCMDCRLEVVR